MEPIDYQKSLDAELQALIAAGADIQTFTTEVPKTVAECCGKAVDECQCTSTSSKEDEYIFTGSTYSLEEFAVSKHVMQLVSTRNILSILFTDISHENVSTEFIRFMSFIRKHPEPGRSQLATLILPVTVHLYVLLMQADKIGVEGARTFLNLNANVLSLVEGYKETLAALSKFNDIEELKQDSRFQLYIERKTVIKLAKDVFQSLQNFLRSSKNILGETILLSVLAFNIDFVDSDVYSCPYEDSINKEGESSGECKKSEIDDGGEKELKHKDPDLENIEITKFVIYPKKPVHSMITYDFDTEEVVVMDDISEYTEPKKKAKSIDVKPVRLRNFFRSASNRFIDVQQKIKELEVESKPKKEKEVESDSSLRSVHSVDFNCGVTEIAYATGDSFIYTLAIATPEKKKKKTIKFIKDTTVTVRTFKHNESGLKSTRDPENLKVFVVKYLPGEPFSLLAACSSKVRLFNTKTCTFLAEYVTDWSFIYDIDVDSTGQYFATATHYLASYIYTFGLNTKVRILTGHEKAVTAVKFHPNGIYVATGSEDCTVRLFEVESGQCVRLFVGHLFGVWVMDFSYDGNLIASADSSGLVNVWDIKDCTVISKMAMRIKEEMYNVINSLCFHESSFILAACNEKGEVQFWDARNPEHKHVLRSLKKPIKIKRHKGKDWSIAYMANSQKESVRPKKQ